MMKCPICKVPLEVRDYSDSTMEEYYTNCVDGCKKYSSETWCGNSQYSLGNTELYTSWSMSNTQFKKFQFVFNRVVRRLRKQYRKGKLK